MVNWDEQPLGKMSDKELAKRLWCAVETVSFNRRVRKIAAYKPNRVSGGVDWDKEPLGKVPDADLALKHGVSTSNVGQRRRSQTIRV